MNDTIALLEKLIRTRPVTSDPARVNAASAIMRDYLESHGVFCRVEEFAGRHILYASNRESGTPEIILNSHLDVVPATEDQFEPVVRDGKLFGRGACDCLGNAVCLAEILLKANAHVAAVFSADEETGGETTRHMVDLGYTAKHAVLILDSGDDPTIIYEQKGVLVVHLTAKGRDGHAAYPWKCENPIDKLMAGYAKFREKWRNPASDDDWRNTMSACMMSAGTAPNQIPGEATMTINFRLVDEASRDVILRDLAETTGCEVTLGEDIPPVSFDRNHPVFLTLQRVLSEHVRGGNEIIPLARICGATDSRHWRVLGIPVPVLGVTGANEHSANEYVVLDSIGRYADGIVKFADVLAAQ
ncbi:MAG: M20/M25/M40 family metallo-hydrolase [Lentisphaeria bacterium]|nr:M20/M25/M40 family metallo-hydrolase [Lentisphaeria bacterium]